MNVRTTIKVLSYNHYDMSETGGSKGLRIQVFGSPEDSGHFCGVAVSEATIPNYHELSKLKEVAAHEYPALFEGNLSLSKGKNKSNKEVTTVSFSELKFIESLELVPKKKA